MKTLETISNPFIAMIIIAIFFISYSSYSFLYVKSRNDERNREILKQAMKSYILNGDMYLKDAYGKTMKYDTIYHKDIIIIEIKSAGPSQDFKNEVDNIVIRWSLDVYIMEEMLREQKLEELPPEQKLQTGFIIFEVLYESKEKVTYP